MTSNNWNELLIFSNNFTRKEQRRIIELDNACKQNNILKVLICLSSMNMKEINYQNPIDGNTILHEATRLGFIDIIKLVLKFDASCSLYNHNGKIPSDFAEQDDSQQIFKRSPSDSRFTLDSNNRLSKSLNEYDVKYKSCSHINDQSHYEWELVDDLAYQKALRLRDELKPYTFKNFLEKAIFSIDKGYLKSHLIHLNKINFIRHWFKQASQENNPFHILKAYTKCQAFTKQLNKDMARNIIHDLKIGCSLFSCGCLYSTQDATRSITAILLYHPQFQSLNFNGKVYRGLCIKQSLFTHYTKGSRIITTTFLSTSKNRLVAECFSSSGGSIENIGYISILCIYTIKNQNHTALDITQHSEFREENEVLILPYSSFHIIDIKKDDDNKHAEIYLEECDSILLNL